jgi:hypothetical protein
MNMQNIQSKDSELPSLYDEKQFKKAAFRVNKITLALAVFLLLLLARFLNLGLWWLMAKAEMSGKPSIPGASYTFLNFSSRESAMKKMQENRHPQNRDNRPRVVAYFNILHPGIFLVRNSSGGLAPVDLGKAVVMAPPGDSTFTLSLADGITMERTGQTASGNFAHSILFNLAGLGDPAKSGVSFSLKSPGKTSYAHIPYLIYFLAPLIAILVLSNFYTPALFTAYFYFPLLFLLFDFRLVFCRVPLSWLVGVSEKQGLASPEVWISLVMLGLLTAAGVAGLMNWKQRRDVYKETLIVWFFLLLPLFLRF